MQYRKAFEAAEKPGFEEKLVKDITSDSDSEEEDDTAPEGDDEDDEEFETTELAAMPRPSKGTSAVAILQR